MKKVRPVIFLLFAGLFFLLGIAITFFLDKPTSGVSLASEVAVSLSRELASAEKEAHDLMSNPRDYRRWTTVKNSFFLVDSGRVKSWSKNDFAPDWRTTLEMSSVRVLQNSSGDYLLKKWPLQGDSFLLLVIPLRKNYAIVNNYLGQEWNTKIFRSPVRIGDPTDQTGSPVCLPDTGCIFSVTAPIEGPPEAVRFIAFTFFMLAVLLFALFAGRILLAWHEAGNYQKTFLGLTITLAGIRITLVELNFPSVLIKFTWFDPRQFASSSFNASIGDLFLNSVVVLVLAYYLFLYYSKFRITRRLLLASKQQQAIAAVLCLFLAFLALLFPYLYSEIIYHNSSISLEITQSLLLGETRITAFLSLMIGCVSSFLMLHILTRLALRLQRKSEYGFLPLLVLAASLFLLFFVVTARSYWITLLLGSSFFLALVLFRLPVSLARLTFKTFLYFLVIVILFSLQGARGIQRFQEEKKIQDLFRYGNNFLVDQDVLGEYLLNESTRRIQKDPFIQLRLSSPFLSKVSVRQKIKLFYLSSYFDRYDVQVYLYNAEGQPHDNLYALDFTDFVQRYQNDAYKTVYPGIYFINNPSVDNTKKYLVIIPVKRFGLNSGYVVLDLTQKKVIPQNVYPELLVDNRFSHYMDNADLSYAYYTQGKLTSSFGDFNYENNFDLKMLNGAPLFQSGITERGYYHVGIEDKGGRIAVVTMQRYPVFFLVTNFSFFFILGLGVILFYLFFAGVSSWVRGRRLNYSARIQLYVYLAFFFPLLAVSITTLSLISRSNKDLLTKEYGDKARTLSEKISENLQEFENGSSETQSDFQNQLIEQAKLINADASVYTPAGNLLASSQPAIYESHLVSPFINREAWNSIVVYRNNTFMANEEIGKLRYNCSYAAIKSPETGRMLGILSIPFFSSAVSLEKSQINVLANILTVFVVIFILFSFLSFFVAKMLTFPLRFITQSLQRTSLTATNQRIVWNSKDEIGLMASEYNRMLQNLEESKNELARSQKESAWREIARQVAHEIKNPLTPMKLTLQQWERAIAAGEISPERAKKSIDILLTQLDTLNDIAGSFSAFARMPAPQLSRLEVVRLLKQVIGLHASLQEGTVKLTTGDAPVFIDGDDQLLGRIFSNLILNALQSGSDGKIVTVVVRVIARDYLCRIEIEDDGQGIDESVRDRVFLPKFSTKKTGSGLGLAIVKQGVQQSGGRIWFETTTGKGTTFYIEFPESTLPSIS